MPTPTHAEFIQGLRELADFYESHPEVKLPVQSPYYILDATKEEILTAARAFGRSEKFFAGNSFFLKKEFPSGQELSVYTDRSQVCTAKEVGQRVELGCIIPAQPEQRTPDRLVPIIEWDCHPLLAPEPVQKVEKIAPDLDIPF